MVKRTWNCLSSCCLTLMERSLAPHKRWTRGGNWTELLSRTQKAKGNLWNKMKKTKALGAEHHHEWNKQRLPALILPAVLYKTLSTSAHSIQLQVLSCSSAVHKRHMTEISTFRHIFSSFPSGAFLQNIACSVKHASSVDRFEMWDTLVSFVCVYQRSLLSSHPGLAVTSWKKASLCLFDLLFSLWACAAFQWQIHDLLFTSEKQDE